MSVLPPKPMSVLPPKCNEWKTAQMNEWKTAQINECGTANRHRPLGYCPPVQPCRSRTPTPYSTSSAGLPRGWAVGVHQERRRPNSNVLPPPKTGPRGCSGTSATMPRLGAPTAVLLMMLVTLSLGPVTPAAGQTVRPRPTQQPFSHTFKSDICILKNDALETSP